MLVHNMRVKNAKGRVRQVPQVDLGGGLVAGPQLMPGDIVQSIVSLTVNYSLPTERSGSSKLSAIFKELRRIAAEQECVEEMASK